MHESTAADRHRGQCLRKREQIYPPGIKQWFFDSSVTFRGIPLFVYLLPYLEENGLFENWQYGDPMLNANQDEASNTAVVLPIMICPSDEIAQNPIVFATGNWTYALGSYGATAGRDPTFRPPQRPTACSIRPARHRSRARIKPPSGRQDISDGLSHTLLFGERSHYDPNYSRSTPRAGESCWTSGVGGQLPRTAR